jgi:hypothetical protein
MALSKYTDAETVNSFGYSLKNGKRKTKIEQIIIAKKVAHKYGFLFTKFPSLRSGSFNAKA